MNNFVFFFENISSFQRSLILVGGIAFFWMIESHRPMFVFSYIKWKHALINFFFTLTTILVNFSLAFLLLLSASFAEKFNIGILNAFESLPLWLYILVGILLLDLVGAYFAHWIQHKISWLWNFHFIHHSDKEVDTTTANRHHPGESFVRFVFTAIGIVIIGTPLWLVFAYQSMSVVFSQFNHANLTLPRWLDSAISLIIVSPDMHKVHHHFEQPYTDNNYGNIFSIWDRIFGTFAILPKEEIIYGVDSSVNSSHEWSIVSLLKEPFSKRK